MKQNLVQKVLIVFVVILFVLLGISVIDFVLFLILVVVFMIVYSLYNYQLSHKKDINLEQSEEFKICTVCGTKNINNRKYCRNCNTNIQHIICPVCGEKNDYRAKYCHQCDSILQVEKRHHHD